MLVPVICYRCSKCNRIYEAAPNECICERKVYIKGERFGAFLILDRVDNQNAKVKCVLCGNNRTILYSNIRDQQSCGCKPRHIEILDITGDVCVYKCRRCINTRTCNLPIAMYCCEDKDE